MNRKLVFIVLLIVASVCLVSSTDDGDDNGRNGTTGIPQGEDEDNNNSMMADSNTTAVYVVVNSFNGSVVDSEDDEYDSQIYTTETSNSNDTVNEVIGSKLPPTQLCGLLKRDFKESYQKKCTKISGDENAFDELVKGKEELKNSTKMWLKSQGEIVKNATEVNDYKIVATSFCQKRHELVEYMTDFSALKDRCSFPREIKRENQIRDLLKAISDATCSNGGNDLASLVSRDGEGRKCITINKAEIKTCGNKALYAFLKRVLKKFIENEYFEFKMDKEDCEEFDAASECFVSAVENCVDPIAKNQFTSIFAIFREQTNCATFT